MKLKRVWRTSLLTTLAAICLQPSPAFTPQIHGMLRPSPEPLPDLVVILAHYNDPMVTVRVKNVGAAPAGPSVLAVLLLKKTDPDTGKPEAFTFPLGGLAAGASIQRTFSIGNKAFTSNGALAVRLDYKNQIVEVDEFNNQKDVLTITLPDLIIQNVEIVGNTATVHVFNRCTGNGGPAKVDMTIYKGADKKSGWESRLSADLPPLMGNSKAAVVIELKSYPSVSTTTFSGRYVRVEVDLTNQIKEAVESNNWWETGAGPFPDAGNSCSPPN